MTLRLHPLANAPSTPSSRRSRAPLHRSRGIPTSLSGPGPPPGRNGGERLALRSARTFNSTSAPTPPNDLFK
jgi:hypothetical protein